MADFVDSDGNTWFKGGTLTAGQLRKALEGVPDDAEVGTTMLDAFGAIQKTMRVAYLEEPKILLIDSSRHQGYLNDVNETLCDGDAVDLVQISI